MCYKQLSGLKLAVFLQDVLRVVHLRPKFQKTTWLFPALGKYFNIMYNIYL